MRFLILLLPILFTQLFSSELEFEKNKGQFNSDIRYVLQLENRNILISENGFTIDNFIIEENNKKGHVVKFNTNTFNNSTFEELHPSKSIKNIIRNSSKVTDIKFYTELIQKNIYPGIDIRYYIDNNNFRYDFIVNPGADPNRIKIDFEGASIKNAEAEELVFQTSIGDLNMGSLFAYQKIDGIKEKVDCSFNYNSNSITFKNGNYNPTKTLIIDPMFYSTYFGGGDDDEIISIEVINSNNYIVVGNTNTFDFQTTPGAYQESLIGLNDVFVSKFTRVNSFTSIEFTTLIGGTNNDIATDIEINPDNNIVIAGYTESTDFPTELSLQQTLGGSQDAFILILDENGDALEFSTYFGGSQIDKINDIELGRSGEIYFGGETNSSDYQVTTSAYQTDKNALRDGCFGMISEDGRRLVFSSFIGGGDEDVINGIDVDQNEAIYLAGSTRSFNFPTAPSGFGDRAYDEQKDGNWDMFFSKLVSEGSNLETSTYFGGTNDDFGIAIHAQFDGSTIFVGNTVKESGASQIPIQESSYQLFNRGKTDIMVGKLSEKKRISIFESQELMFNSYLGGSEDDIVTDLIVQEESNLITLCGYTGSRDFPDKYDGDVDFGGNVDAFMTTMSANASALVESIYFGGNGIDMAMAFDLDENKNLYLVGSTQSFNFTENDFAYQKEYSSGKDAFIAHHLSGTLEIAIPLGGETICKGEQLEISYLLEGYDDGDIIIELYDEVENVIYPISNEGTNGFSWVIPDSIPAGTNYKVIVNHSTGLISSSEETFEIKERPQIVSFTSNVESALCLGESIVLSVQVETDQNIDISWYKGSDRLPGVSGTSLTISDVSLKDEGDYYVRISGDCNSNVRSEDITLSILDETVLNSPTTDRDIERNIGQNIEFRVSASGNNLSYQWYFNDEMLADENNNNLNLTNLSLEDSGTYYCNIEGSCGDPIKSPSFNLNVIDPVSVQDLNFEIDRYFVESNTLKVHFISENECHGNIVLTDLNGNNVAYMKNYRFKSGENFVTFDVSSLNSSIYLLNLHCERFSKTLKISLVD